MTDGNARWLFDLDVDAAVGVDVVFLSASGWSMVCGVSAWCDGDEDVDVSSDDDWLGKRVVRGVDVAPPSAISATSRSCGQCSIILASMDSRYSRKRLLICCSFKSFSIICF